MAKSQRPVGMDKLSSSDSWSQHPLGVKLPQSNISILNDDKRHHMVHHLYVPLNVHFVE